MKRLCFVSVVVLYLVLSFSFTSIQAGEGDYFPLCLWFVGEENPYPGYISENEKYLFREIGANWILGGPEADYMAFCNETGGAYKMVIGGDPFGGNSIWYYSKRANNYPAEWWTSGVDTAITRVHETYGNCSGFWGYLVAHEDAQYDTSKYDGLQYICLRIHQIDPDHKSYIVGLSPSRMQRFYSWVDSLDVLEVYNYVFTRDLPYAGTELQSALETLISLYQVAMDSLKDKHTVWRAGFQTCRYGRWEGSEWVWTRRWPTATEIRCQAYLGLTRGAKGIMYFTYFSQQPFVGEGIEGLLTRGNPREKRWVPIPGMPGGGYFPFDAVRDLNSELSVLGPHILDLYPVAAFTNDEVPASNFVESVTGNYIEVGTFLDTLNEIDYLMLVNRMCSNEDGSPADSQAVTVEVEPNWAAPGEVALVMDMLTGDLTFVPYQSGRYLFDKTLGPGEGKLLQIRPVGDHMVQVPDDYPTIQQAIDAASDGDTVLVAPATYLENINFLGKAITVGSYFIYDHNSATIEATIIDGSSPDNPDSASVVRFVSGEGSNSILDGFAITGGRGTSQLGPGRPEHRGGGIFCSYSSPNIINNLIIDNHIPDHGSDFDWGGGIGCLMSSPLIANNLIVSNSCVAGGVGGGICFKSGGSPIIVNNTLVDNTGGGIYLWNVSDPFVLSNNIIANNPDFGIWANYNSYGISYNDVWNNDGYNFVDCPSEVGDTSWGTNGNGTPCDSFCNIIRDPIFVDSGTDYHLQGNSPCINAGDNNAPSLPGLDFDGNPRIKHGVVDIGAYEYQAESPQVIYYSHLALDSMGNNNGVPNPGEPISVSITVKNVGGSLAHSVSATLRSYDTLVTITDSVKYFGEIESGMTASSQGEYVFEVNPSCPDSHIVECTLEVNSDSVWTWTSTFTQMVVEPDFVITASPNSQTIRRGDTTSFNLYFTPLGGFIWPVDLSVSTLPGGVSGFFDPPEVTPPDTSVFWVYTTSEADSGTHVITIIASGASVLNEKDLTLRIEPRSNYGIVFHVSPTGSDTQGDGSPENPFRTIQKGISAAWRTDDTVLVERGAYEENLDFSGKNIMVASHYILDGMESTIESTIIDGGGDCWSPVVKFTTGEDSTAVLRGFSVINGGYDGGIRCENSGPSLIHNIFVDNCSTYYPSSAPAIQCFNSWARITRNLIHGNWKDGIGITGYGYVQLTNNTICYNERGGINIGWTQGSIPEVKNNIVVCNVEYGIYTLLGGENSYFCYNDVWGNASNYAGTLQDQTGICGNISVDPFFTAPDKGNYYLFPLSPCINAGDPNDSVPPGGEPTVDIGAFEYTSFYGPISSNTTWEKPVHVVGDVTVESDATLTIMPNTTVIFDSTDISQSGIDTSMCELIVEGSLRALGSKSDSITFMSTDTSEHPPSVASLKGSTVEGSLRLSPGFKQRQNEAVESALLLSEEDTTGAWYGIRVLLDGSARLNYATIVDVYTGINLANTAADTVSNCFLLNNQVGISCSNSNALIMNNRVCHWPVGSVAIHLEDISNSLSLKDNLLENYRTHVYAANCSTSIDGNTLLACDYDNEIGIHCIDSKYFKIKSTHIARRKFSQCYIKADHSNVHIDNCRLEGVGWQMTPIGISLTDCDGSIRRTKITNYADTGIVAHHYGIEPGCLDLGTESSWGYNSIYSDSSDIAVSNQTGRQIMAQYNWWGTKNPSDTFFVGEVEYIPYLTERPHSIYDYPNCIKTSVSANTPKEFQLLQNYPNPFNPQTRISYDLPIDSRVRITIFNILGQRVKVLVDELQTAGQKTVTWDGKNEDGHEVASGIYFYRLEAGDFTDTKSMVLLK